LIEIVYGGGAAVAGAASALPRGRASKPSGAAAARSISRRFVICLLPIERDDTAMRAAAV
jgi:hypothetical protein